MRILKADMLYLQTFGKKINKHYEEEDVRKMEIDYKEVLKY